MQTLSISIKQIFVYRYARKMVNNIFLNYNKKKKNDKS